MVKQEILEEAVKYFKDNRGFDRMMKKMKEKYHSFEREAPGTIVIERPSQAEKEALSGFMKKDYSRNKNISINLKKFQERLDETRFSGATVKEILEKYFGGEIISNQEQKRREKQDLQNFMQNIKDYCKCTETVDIIDEMLSKTADELARIKREYHRDKMGLEIQLKKAINAIENLPEKQESLPIFAAKVNGDPHSLDRNRLAGQMFLRFLIAKNELVMKQKSGCGVAEHEERVDEGLNENGYKANSFRAENNEKYNNDYKKNKNAFNLKSIDELEIVDISKKELSGELKEAEILNENRPKTTEEIAEIYYNNNILIDEMSNMVLVRNLIALKSGQVHEGWKAFCDKNEAMQVTLYNLSHIDEVRTNANLQRNEIKRKKSNIGLIEGRDSKSSIILNETERNNFEKYLKIKKCLIVENPGVFANIIQDEELKEIPMVCTYGQVKLAGIILLRKLVEEGVELYYSGDIDPEGMQIADKLKKRFGNKLTLIGFDEETYKKNKSNVSLSEIRLKKLDSLEDAELRKTAKLLKQDKVAAYEELNIDGLKKIVRKWGGGR